MLTAIRKFRRKLLFIHHNRYKEKSKRRCKCNSFRFGSLEAIVAHRSFSDKSDRVCFKLLKYNVMVSAVARRGEYMRKLSTSRFGIFFWKTVFVLILVLQTEAPSVAASKDRQNWVSVPVFFATTRKRSDKKESYGGERNIDKDDQGIEYGVVTVTVPLQAGEKFDKASAVKLQWKEADKSKGKVTIVNNLTRDEFYKELQLRHQSTEFEETCIFVHGYNNSFAGAAGSAARLELALKEPVVLFSWPSSAKLRGYTVDECNAEWSVRPFQIFMQGLEKLLDSKHMMTVSHSMGNRLVNWYLQSRYDRAKEQPERFREVVLTSPDIDRATFKNYFFKVAKNADKTRIYVSAKDVPLRLSKFVHGSPRTGDDLNKDENKWDLPGNLEGTQSINFTDVDSGAIGHSIQYKIIGSMHRDEQPGDGLLLEEDQAFKGKYLRVRHAK